MKHLLNNVVELSVALVLLRASYSGNVLGDLRSHQQPESTNFPLPKRYGAFESSQGVKRLRTAGNLKGQRRRKSGQCPPKTNHTSVNLSDLVLRDRSPTIYDMDTSSSIFEELLTSRPPELSGQISSRTKPKTNGTKQGKRGNPYPSNLRFEYPNEEAIIRSRTENLDPSNFNHICKTLLVAAYFYLDIRPNSRKRKGIFSQLIKIVENQPMPKNNSLSTLKSAVYYWYARSLVQDYCETQNSEFIVIAEHVLKRQVENGEGCVKESQLLLADIMLNMRHDYKGAALMYDSAIKEGCTSPQLLVNSWRLQLHAQNNSEVGMEKP